MSMDVRNLKKVTKKVTVYRENSVAQVVYENVKTVFWTAGDTVLVIAVYTDDATFADQKHYYVHWLREHVCWFKVETLLEPIQ